MFSTMLSFALPVALSAASLTAPFEDGYQQIYRLDGLGANHELGIRTATGDWNGDGHLDVASAAWGGEENVGLIHVIYATEGFPGVLETATLHGMNRGDRAGFAIWGNGDINGDEIDDLLVGCHLRPAPSTTLVFFGNPDGMSESADMVLYGELPRDYFGYSVCTFDANRDGWLDIIVGADDDGNRLCGSVSIFYGGPLLDDQRDALVMGHWKVTHNTGSMLAPLGDIDGDLHPELLIGDHDILTTYTDGRGRAFLTTGSDETGTLVLNHLLPGDQVDGRFSWGITGIGDWDLDGLSDFAISTPRYSVNNQKIGAAGRIVVHHGDSPFDPEPWDVLNGTERAGRFGEALWGWADVTMDGINDLIVTEPGFDNRRGRFTVFMGAPGVSLITADTVVVEGSTEMSEWGVSVVGGLDLDLDGRPEIAVGAPKDSRAFNDAGALEIWEWTPGGGEEEAVTKNAIVVFLGGIRELECLEGEEFGACRRIGTKLLPRGVHVKNFINSGRTGQQSGRAMVACGTRLSFRGGPNSPDQPSLVQQWRELTGAPAEAAWVIGANNEASVDDGLHPLYAGRELGPVEEYGYSDVGAAQRLLQVVQQHRPRLAFLVFQEPDGEAQYSNHPWRDYRKAIDVVDSLAWEIERTVRGIPGYGAQTAIFYTDYHGRNSDDNGGFEWHGDSCTGCRNITFVATGPEFPAGVETNEEADLIDLHATLAAILGVPVPRADGRVMEEIFLPGRSPKQPDLVPVQANGINSQTPPGLDATRITNSALHSRMPDVHRIGADYYLTWSEAHPGFDGHAWDLLSVQSDDRGTSWSAPTVILAASDTLRPWKSSLAGDEEEGLLIGTSALEWRPFPVEKSWDWRVLGFRIPAGTPDVEALAVPRSTYAAVNRRPALCGRDESVLHVSNDSFYKRHNISWTPTPREVISWSNNYNWSDFGYPDQVVVTMDNQGPVALESLRAGNRGILHATRQDGKKWVDLSYIFATRQQAALQPAVGAAGDRVIALWIDDRDGVNNWQLRSAYTDAAPGDWSEGVLVAPGTGPAWNPDIWVEEGLCIAVWEDYASGSPRILLNRSSDGGETWGSPQTMTTQEARTPRIAADPEGALVVWEQFNQGESNIFTKRISFTQEALN